MNSSQGQRTTNSLAVHLVASVALIATLVAGVTIDRTIASGWLKTSVAMPLPVFKECGNAFMGYVPDIDAGPCFYADCVPDGKRRAFLQWRGQKLVQAASVERVRRGLPGSSLQVGRLIWFSLPGAENVNQPGTSLFYTAMVRPKPMVQHVFYGCTIGGLILVALSALLRLLSSRFAAARHLLMLCEKASSAGRSFAGKHAIVLLSIALLIGVRVATLPPLFNFLDTFTMLRTPLQVVGHMPPLYLVLIAALKSKLGLGPALLGSLMLIQYSCFAGALFYLCQAFDTLKQKLLTIALVALNFYVVLIAGGLMTESLAISEFMCLLGALFRIARKQKIQWRDAAVFSIMCVLCIWTRHTFITLATALPLFAGLIFAFDTEQKKQRLKVFILSCVLFGVSTVAGLKLCELGFLMSGSEYKVPRGRFGVIMMARFWQRALPEERKAIYRNLEGTTNDAIVRSTFKTILSFPPTDQNNYGHPLIYERIKETVRTSCSAADYARACNIQSLEEATATATSLFLTHPDRASLSMLGEVFLQYTQVRELLLHPNPLYAFSVIRSLNLKDSLGDAAWNVPHVQWGYLNRCLLDHSAISEMWCHLCPDTVRLTERIFSPDCKNAVRDAINSKLFWALDWINPATNLCFLWSGLLVAAATRRLSRGTCALSLALFFAAILFDALHAVAANETLSRYLAPSSFCLAIGGLLTWLDVFRIGLLASPQTTPTIAPERKKHEESEKQLVMKS